jgi:hypothetical protein
MRGLTTWVFVVLAGCGAEAYAPIDGAGPAAAALTQDEGGVYWLTRAGDLVRLDKLGSGVAVLAPGPPPRDTLAVDDGDAFWAAEDGVYRLSRGSSTAERLAPGERIGGLAVTREHVYFSVDGLGGASFSGVRRVARTGGTPEDVLAGVETPTRLLVDETALFVLSRLSARVLRQPLTGGDAVAIADLGWDNVFHLVADATRLYWTASSYELRSAPKLGGGHAILAELGGGALAVDGDDLVWIGDDAGEPAVLRIAKDGGAPTVVARPGPLDGEAALAMDDDRIYVLAPDGRLLRFAR